MNTTTRAIALASFAAISPIAAARPPIYRGSPPCTPAWVPTFGGVPGVPGIVRAFARFDDGTGEALYFTCSVGGAALSEDWNAFMSTHASALGQPIAAGAHVWAQAWFRDPPAPKTTNLSDGLVFVVGP